MEFKLRNVLQIEVVKNKNKKEINIKKKLKNSKLYTKRKYTGVMIQDKLISKASMVTGGTCMSC